MKPTEANKPAVDAPVETHPFEPFLPADARVLIMGTFPPQPKRWAMKFYYPNRTNDFWFVMGLLFFGDRDALYDRGARQYRLDKIKTLLMEKGIALNDTGYRIRRLAGNASDKFLEIVEPVNLSALLERIPFCHTLATTGEKAAATLAQLTDSTAPKMGNSVIAPNGLTIWRMPSTSRAYPLPLEAKADYYRRLFSSVGLL